MLGHPQLAPQRVHPKEISILSWETSEGKKMEEHLVFFLLPVVNRMLSQGELRDRRKLTFISVSNVRGGSMNVE